MRLSLSGLRRVVKRKLGIEFGQLLASEHENPALHIINRAARVARIHGRRILRFAHNPATQVLYDQVLDRVAA
jgi:hypothetical protein